MRLATVRDLGSALRGARQQQGLNQQELASSAGVSRQWISTVEAGTSNPGIRQVLATLDALNLTLRIDDDAANPNEPPSSAEPKASTMNLDDILTAMGRIAHE